MLVEDIMSRPVRAVEPEYSVLEALNLARFRRIRHVPVVESLGIPNGTREHDFRSLPPAPEKARLVGIVSDRDLRDACPSVLSAGATDFSALARTRVADIMRTDVVTVHPHDPVEEAARLLYEHHIGCLPVVSGQGLVGIVTETDVLRAIVTLLGVSSPGSHLEVEVPDRPGHLGEVTRLIGQHQVNISSVLIVPGRREHTRVLVLRVQTIDPRHVVKHLEEAGYRVLWPSGPKLA
ncbi:MAG: acetoin utilization AcuB family protein [Bacillota bacterium]